MLQIHLVNQVLLERWLLELAANAFRKDPDLEKIKGVVGASKTTGWTIESACELGSSNPNYFYFTDDAFKIKTG